MGVARKIVVAFKDIYENDGYSIMQNGGKFCDYGHAHFHVFPRYDNDGFGWTYPEGESEYSERVAEKIRKDCRGELERHSRIYMIMKSFLRGIRK